MNTRFRLVHASASSRHTASRILGASVVVALVCWSAAAGAQNTYSLTARALGQNSRSWMAPVQGPVSCPADFLWATGMQTMTPAPTTGPVSAMNFGVNGCVGGSATVTTTGAQDIDMVGAKVTIPTNVVSLPLPGMLNVIPIPTAVSIIQVATSFSQMGPVKASQRLEPLGASMSGTFAVAPWRVFQAGAWMNQTGRAGPTFTWCPGPGGMGITGCPSPAQGNRPLIIKNIAGDDNFQGFGGTMGSIFYGGTNVASFAQAQPLGLFPMSIALAAIEPCAGLGPAGCMENSATTPFGRGYAAYVTQMAVIADVFSMYQLTTVNPPTYAVLAMVSGANIGTVAGATQDSANFPWTTGNVIVRQTGRTPQGMVNVITVTAEGHDTVTSGGARNIHVVAGKITSALVAGLLEFHYAAIGQAEMSISMPEPSPRLAMLAGVIALLGLAAWRARDR
jgi:hypothetical protein